MHYVNYVFQAGLIKGVFVSMGYMEEFAVPRVSALAFIIAL
jgi:hypothetical protein